MHEPQAWPATADHLGDRIRRLQQSVVARPPYVLLSPGYHLSSHHGELDPVKHYPHWAALSDAIEREAQLPCVVNLFGRDALVYPRFLCPVFDGDLAQLVVTISYARAVICSDSGVAHLAAVIGAPVIVLLAECYSVFPRGAARAPLGGRARVYPLVRPQLAELPISEVLQVLHMARAEAVT